MATADTFITFGADSGQLEAGLAAAQASVRATAAEMRTLASDMVKTGVSADSELGGRLSALGSKLSQAKETVAGFKTELKGAGEGAAEGGPLIGKLTEGVSGFLSPLNEAKAGLAEFAEAAGVAFAVEKVGEFIKSMGELGEQTERSSKILGISTEDVGRLNYVFGITGMSTERLNQMFGRFEEGLAKAASTGTGPMVAGLRALGLSAQELIGLSIPEQIDMIADAVMKLADSPTKTAALQALGRGWVEMIPTLDKGGEALRQLREQADATNSLLSDPAAEALEDTKQRMYDLGTAIEGDAMHAFLPFADSVNVAIQVLRDLIAAASDSIAQGGTWAAALWGITQAVKVLDTALIALVELFRTFGSVAVASMAVSRDSAVGAAKSVWDAVHGDFAAAERDAKAAFDKITEDIKGAGGDWVKATKDAIAEMNKLWPSLPGMTGPGAEGGVSPEAAGKVQDLSKITVESAGKFADAIRKAAAEAGISADLMAKQIYKESGFSPIAVSSAGAKGIAQFMPGTAAQYGVDTSDPFSSIAGAGRYMRDLMKAFNGDVALALAAYNAGETSIKRRLETGRAFPAETQAYVASIMGTGGKPQAPAMDESAPRKLQDEIDARTARLTKLRAEGGDAALIKETEDELAKLKTRQLEATQAASGGTATQKANLAIAEAEAVQQQNALTVAKQKLAAANADAAANRAIAGDKQKQTELDAKAAEAAANVLKVTNQQAEAEARVTVAKAKQAGDFKAIYEAEVAAANVKMKAAGEDPVKQAEAQQALIAAQTAYTNAVRDEATERGRLEIEKAKETADQERIVLNEKLKTHQITDAQWLAGTTEALNREKAVVTSVYASELASAKDNSNKKIAIAAEEQKALGAISKQEAQDRAKAAEDASKAWKSAADTVANTISGQVDGIIKGTTTVKQAFSNMAISIVEDVVKYAIKWEVEHAFAATSVMAMNNTVVAATLAGDATKAASATASGAAGIAAQSANAVQSLAIDAAKVFGGIFGFLAPLLGPFAAGPAAGGEATVLSAGAAFDTGAWELPRDMIAGVHRGEMVIPSRGGVADEFRSFMTDGGFNKAGTAGVGAPSGGNKSVMINPQTHLHVSTMDGASFSSFINANHRTLMGAVDRAVRHGAGLGLRTFTP